MYKRILGFLVALSFFVSVAQAAEYKPTLLFVPHDDRPVSFHYTIDTVTAAGYNILVPPDGLIGTRDKPGDPDRLWQWVFSAAQEADALVLSSDMLLYGGLVSSRRHDIPEDMLLERVENFAKLKKLNPDIKLYVFTTIMRSPRSSAGNTEPPYYEQYGPAIFQVTALEDKAELQPLNAKEQAALAGLKQSVPQAVMNDWLQRRAVNLKANEKLIVLAQQNVFDYLVLGRDDNAPYSQTHRENRLLMAQAKDLPAYRFASLPGVDELGMVLLTHAVNDLTFQVPTVSVQFARGQGPAVIPSYADEEIGVSITSHLFASGAVPLLSQPGDFTLAINTNEQGFTGEAGTPDNLATATPAASELGGRIEAWLKQNVKVAVADISYANGADNGFMASLEKRRVLPKLLAYSGWNTPNNSVGFAIGQATMAMTMDEAARKRLLAVRLLDDWGYQANIRSELVNEILVPQGGNYFYLNQLKPAFERAASQKMRSFAAMHLSDFEFLKIQTDFPWNRVFELNVDAAIKN